MGAPGSSATEVAAGWLWSCCRPAFSSTDQTGRKRTITHSTAGTICHQGLRSTLKAQDDRVPMCIPGTLRLFSLTHSPRSALCSCSLAAYSAYDYDAATPSHQHQLSFCWLAKEKKTPRKIREACMLGRLGICCLTDRPLNSRRPSPWRHRLGPSRPLHRHASPKKELQTKVTLSLLIALTSLQA